MFNIPYIYIYPMTLPAASRDPAPEPRSNAARAARASGALGRTAGDGCAATPRGAKFGGFTRGLPRRNMENKRKTIMVMFHDDILSK